MSPLFCTTHVSYFWSKQRNTRCLASPIPMHHSLLKELLSIPNDAFYPEWIEKMCSGVKTLESVGLLQAH